MHVSADQIAELKSLFIGAPRRPTGVWLEPVSGPALTLHGEGVSEADEGFRCDFGSVPAMADSTRRVRVENLGGEPAEVEIEAGEPWLDLRWQGGADPAATLEACGGSAVLELIYHGQTPDDESLETPYWLRWRAPSGQRGSLRATAHLDTWLEGPCAVLDFNGRPSPGLHDFGRLDPTQPSTVPPFRLTLRSHGRRPLAVAFEELPRWLQADMPASGALEPGAFPVGAEPVVVELRPTAAPEFIGLRHGVVRLCLNDVRPERRRVALHFVVTQRIDAPLVTCLGCAPLRLVAPGERDARVVFENAGNVEARVRLRGLNPGLSVPSEVLVPAAVDSLPGRVEAQVCISAEELDHKPQTLEIECTVEGGVVESFITTLDAEVVHVMAEPTEIDFGRVRGRDARSVKVEFRATDDSEVLLAARTLPELARDLTARVVEGRRVEVVLEHPPAELACRRFDDFGLQVIGVRPAFEMKLKVRFERVVAKDEGRPV